MGYQHQYERSNDEGELVGCRTRTDLGREGERNKAVNIEKGFGEV
jgi:hypothetical protein